MADGITTLPVLLINEQWRPKSLHSSNYHFLIHGINSFYITVHIISKQSSELEGHTLIFSIALIQISTTMFPFNWNWNWLNEEWILFLCILPKIWKGIFSFILPWDNLRIIHHYHHSYCYFSNFLFDTFILKICSYSKWKGGEWNLGVSKLYQ